MASTALPLLERCVRREGLVPALEGKDEAPINDMNAFHDFLRRIGSTNVRKSRNPQLRSRPAPMLTRAARSTEIAVQGTCPRDL